MPKRIEGVSKRLLDCAQKEFLEKGFVNASVRTIAAQAHTSTRAIYTRFHDKEGLFSALVEPAYSYYLQLLEESLKSEWNIYNSSKTSESAMNAYIKPTIFVYEHLDEFLLIVKASSGTIYEDFIEKLANINEKNLFAHVGEQTFDNSKADKVLFHMILRAFYDGLFEPVRHGLPQEQAIHYVSKLTSVFTYGVQSVW